MAAPSGDRADASHLLLWGSMGSSRLSHELPSPGRATELITRQGAEEAGTARFQESAPGNSGKSYFKVRGLR